MVRCRVWGHRQRREGGSCGGRDENGMLLEKVVVEDAEKKAAVNHNPPQGGVRWGQNGIFGLRATFRGPRMYALNR